MADNIGGGVRVDAGGRFYMEGGQIAGNRGLGAGMIVQNVSGYANAVFTMRGGEISGNEDSFGGVGGVIVISTLTNAGGEAIFIMEDGKITGNEAIRSPQSSLAGGVAVFGAGATFVMKDGEITHNRTGGVASAGGVIVEFGSKFYMEGGKIANNESSGHQSQAGGVIIFDSTFTMRGGKIFGNEANGNNTNAGGVFVSGERGIFAMQGGEIFGNVVSGHTVAGGVVANWNGTFQMSNGIIYGVDAEDGRGNSVAGVFGSAVLFLQSNGTAQHGTFDADGEFDSLGTLTATNYTIHVVNGELQ